MNSVDTMDVTYKRGFEHNYLIVKGDDNTAEIRKNNYRIRMMLENRIDNFLKLDMKMNEGIYDYYYEISGMQPLSRVFEHREMKYADLKAIICGIEQAYNSSFEYMLEGEHFVLKPEYIYMNVETKEMEFMYYPDYSLSLQEAFMSIGEYILDRVDHQDSEAVVVAYQLFKTIRAGCFTIKELVSIVEVNGGKSSSETVKMNDDLVDEKENPLLESSIDILQEIDKQDNINLSTKRNKSIWEGIFGKSKSKERSRVHSDNSQYGNMSIEKQTLSSPSQNEDGFKPTPETYGKTMVLMPERSLCEHILIYKNKGKEEIFKLTQLPVTIGKKADMVDIALNDSSVSRIHCEIFDEGDVVYIKDCNSTNGTFINGMQLDAEERISLEVGDELTIGKVRLEYR